MDELVALMITIFIMLVSNDLYYRQSTLAN